MAATLFVAHGPGREEGARVAQRGKYVFGCLGRDIPWGSVILEATEAAVSFASALPCLIHHM